MYKALVNTALLVIYRRRRNRNFLTFLTIVFKHCIVRWQNSENGENK